MSTGVFREIKKEHPNSKIDVICSKLAYPILEKNKNINKIIPIDFFWRKENRNWKAVTDYFKIADTMRKEKYNIGIALRSDLPNIYFLLYKAGVRNRAGYYNLDGGKKMLTNPLLYPEQEQHSSVADMNLVNFSLHMSTKVYMPEVPIDNKDIAYTNIFFDIYSGINKYICIVPGACAKLQTWDKDNYKAIIDWMIAEHPEHHIILAGGKEDESLIDYLSLDSDNNLKPKCIKLINHNLRHLGILFNHADAVLLQDGGPMHLAYAMMGDANRKLFILWGPNPLEHVAPLQGKIIHHKLDCYPCMRQESQCKKPIGQRCMDLITVEEVKKEIEKAIKSE